VHLALVGRAHRPARAVHDGLRIARRLLARLEELAHAGIEYARHRAGILARIADLLVELAELAIAPELVLEAVRRPIGRLDREELAEYDGPRGDRDQHQQQHDGLHQQARIDHERDDRQVLGHRAVPGWMDGVSQSGSPTGRPSLRRIMAMRTRASTRVSPSPCRCAHWRSVSEARRPSATASSTSSMSSSRAGRRYSMRRSRTTKTSSRAAAISECEGPPSERSHSVRARSKKRRQFAW